jgi:hypothetical protein
VDERALLTAVRSRARQKLWGDCALGLLNMGVHVSDHVRSLGLLLAHVREQGAPIYVHASLARGAVESVAWLWWLLAEGEGFDARLGRGIAFLVEDAGLAVKAAHQVPGNFHMPPPGPQELARQQQLLDRLDDARIDKVMDRPGTKVKSVRVTPGGPEHSTSVKVSTLVPRAFPEQPTLYDLLSGVTHARQWGLMDHVSDSDEGRSASWHANPITTSHSVLICLLAAQRAGELFAAYRGHSDQPDVHQMRERHDAFDRELVQYGRAAGVLSQVRPLGAG